MRRLLPPAGTFPEELTPELIQEYLPPELAERFPELPVAIFQEDFPTYI